MNNRKYPRLSDGYHERSPYHPYQSKKQTNCIADSRDRERSPTGSNSRDNSPYSSTNRHSNSSPRSQRTKFPYSRSKDGAKKGSSQSPNDFPHRGSNSHPTERHTKFNHISNNEEFPWSQHVSSSGKVYYYNFKTEKSQWEKPKEWLERERREKETKEKEHNLVGSKEVRDVGLPKDDPNYEKSRNYASKTSIKEFSSNDRRDRSRGHIDERGRENHQLSNSERGQTVVKTTSVHTSALPTVSHRSTPMAATLSGSSVVSPAGSLQDVSPPSTPSSRASIFESSSHTPSPQLVSVSPHGIPYQTSQSPLGHQQLPVRHQAPLQNIFTQVSSSTTSQQCTKPQYSIQQLQSNSAHHGLVNNGNPQTIALTMTSGQSQKTYDVEMGSRPALHPLQQATLLHQRKITESRNHGMSNYQQSTYPVIPHPTLPLSPAATLVKENNKIRKSPGSPVIFAQSHGTKNSPGAKEQFHSVPQIQTSFGSTLSSKAQALPTPVSPIAVQSTPTVNLQTLAKYVDKSLTNHVNNWPTEGAEKQIQRLYDEGCANASDANKVLVQQIQLQSQIDILEMRLDVGTKRISSLKEVTKTLELLLAESDKKSLM